MRIGVPKEIKNNENRVGLVTESAAELVKNGHEVHIETGAHFLVTRLRHPGASCF